MLDPVPGGRELSRGQKRWLLWMPFVAFEMVVYLISRPPEGERNWSDTLIAAVVAALLYFGLWWAISRVAESRAEDRRTTQERVAEAGSRAAIIYDKGERRASEPQSKGS